jgi:hypothetical protein
LSGLPSLIALMMEAVQTSETSVYSYQSTRRYNPEDSHLYTHRRENLKSYQVTLGPIQSLSAVENARAFSYKGIVIFAYF